MVDNKLCISYVFLGTHVGARSGYVEDLFWMITRSAVVVVDLKTRENVLHYPLNGQVKISDIVIRNRVACWINHEENSLIVIPVDDASSAISAEIPSKSRCISFQMLFKHTSPIVFLVFDNGEIGAASIDSIESNGMQFSSLVPQTNLFTPIFSKDSHTPFKILSCTMLENLVFLLLQDGSIVYTTCSVDTLSISSIKKIQLCDFIDLNSWENTVLFASFNPSSSSYVFIGTKPKNVLIKLNLDTDQVHTVSLPTEVTQTGFIQDILLFENEMWMLTCNSEPANFSALFLAEFKGSDGYSFSHVGIDLDTPIALAQAEDFVQSDDLTPSLFKISPLRPEIVLAALEEISSCPISMQNVHELSTAFSESFISDTVFSNRCLELWKKSISPSKLIFNPRISKHPIVICPGSIGIFHPVEVSESLAIDSQETTLYEFNKIKMRFPEVVSDCFSIIDQESYHPDFISRLSYVVEEISSEDDGIKSTDFSPHVSRISKWTEHVTELLRLDSEHSSPQNSESGEPSLSFLKYAFIEQLSSISRIRFHILKCALVVVLYYKSKGISVVTDDGLSKLSQCIKESFYLLSILQLNTNLNYGSCFDLMSAIGLGQNCSLHDVNSSYFNFILSTTGLVHLLKSLNVSCYIRELLEISRNVFALGSSFVDKNLAIWSSHFTVLGLLRCGLSEKSLNVLLSSLGLNTFLDDSSDFEGLCKDVLESKVLSNIQFLEKMDNTIDFRSFYFFLLLQIYSQYNYPAECSRLVEFILSDIQLSSNLMGACIEHRIFSFVELGFYSKIIPVLCDAKIHSPNKVPEFLQRVCELICERNHIIAFENTEWKVVSTELEIVLQSFARSSRSFFARFTAYFGLFKHFIRMRDFRKAAQYAIENAFICEDIEKKREFLTYGISALEFIPSEIDRWVNLHPSGRILRFKQVLLEIAKLNVKTFDSKKRELDFSSKAGIFHELFNEVNLAYLSGLGSKEMSTLLYCEYARVLGNLTSQKALEHWESLIGEALDHYDDYHCSVALELAKIFLNRNRDIPNFLFRRLLGGDLPCFASIGNSSGASQCSGNAPALIYTLLQHGRSLEAATGCVEVLDSTISLAASPESSISQNFFIPVRLLQLVIYALKDIQPPPAQLRRLSELISQIQQ